MTLMSQTQSISSLADLPATARFPVSGISSGVAADISARGLPGMHSSIVKCSLRGCPESGISSGVVAGMHSVHWHMR